MTETMSPRAFIGTAQELVDEVIDLKAQLAHYERYATNADEVVKAERTTIVRLTAERDDLKARLATVTGYVTKADDLIFELRTDNIRLTSQLDGFQADNLKLQTAVKELQETLATVSQNTADASLERFYTDTTIRELARKLNDRDQSLGASRARCMALQKRINDAAAKLDGVKFALGELITY